MHTSSARSLARNAHLARTAIALAALLLLPLQPFTGWTQSTASEPSQKPLVTRDNQPSPNVMLTLDTSWSMIFPYVPEGAFQVNGFTVAFPGFDSPIMHPDDPRHDPGGAKTAVENARVGDGGAIPADLTDTTNVFPRQMRSPDVNRLYYDPRQQYKPWLISKNLVTGDEVRYDNADPAKAWFDPDKRGTADKFAKLSADTTSITAMWCPRIPTAAQKLVCGDKATNGIAYAKSFSPAIYFMLNSSTSDPNQVASYTAYNANDTAATFTKYTGRSDCAGTTCTQTEELRNYANWFVYYRTRLHVVQASIPESFLQLGNTIRAGWGTIHQGNSTIDGATSAIVQSGVRDLSDTRKIELVKWIRNFKSDQDVTNDTAQPKLAGGTPLIAALKGVGEYFKRKDKQGPWATDPNSATGGLTAPLSCRRAYNLLITDGYYANDSSSTIDGDDDNSTKAIPYHGKLDSAGNPKPYTYTAAKPFADGRANTLADVAMQYWKNDLQPDIDNKVPYGNNTLQDDPAFWQHLVQFPIGLGVIGNIPASDLKNQLALLSKTTGGKGWWDGAGNPAAATDPSRIDDLLHAAVNSRGQYFSARNSAELADALTTALNRAAERPGLKEAGVAAASLTMSANNVKYIPSYTATSWVGDVKAFPLDANGVALTQDSDKLWSAAEKLPTAAERKILTWNGTNAVEFFWDNLDAGAKGLITPTLPTGAAGADLVNYIRGDASNEDTATTVGLFRKRTDKLPDFINSTPLLIKGNVDLGYDKFLAGPAQSTYRAFVNAKAARSPVLLIGGNGGMLHAFADYNSTGVVRGQEVFAYVPRTVLPNLSTLSLKSYGKDGNYHRYFVDGPLVETDAYFQRSGEPAAGWKNIVIGTLGAGGKGIFALDVTSTTGLGASSVLWEKSSADTNGRDLGYLLGAPQVGVLPNGDWAVFVGNGVHSSRGYASLMVINLKDGSLSQLDVDVAGANGLGPVTLVKNSSQQVIRAYAGDLKGQVWRFDVVTSGTSSSLKSTLLYQATNADGSAQPITTAPAVTSHPNGGYLVIVGTGKLFDADDIDTTSRQTLYGLWDKPLTSGDSAFGTTFGRSKLVQQTITNDNLQQNYYAMSSNQVDYGKDNVLGWYIDLTIEAGQRVIYPPIIIRDYVLAGTMAPAKAAALCGEEGGHGYNFLLPALTGGQATVPVLDTDKNGIINVNDGLFSVFTSNADGGDTILTKDNDGKLRLSIQNTEGSQEAELPSIGKPGVRPIIARTWRQILTPPH